jgi:hypothetical protein
MEWLRYFSPFGQVLVRSRRHQIGGAFCSLKSRSSVVLRKIYFADHTYSREEILAGSDTGGVRKAYKTPSLSQVCRQAGSAPQRL